MMLLMGLVLALAVHETSSDHCSFGYDVSETCQCFRLVDKGEEVSSYNWGLAILHHFLYLLTHIVQYGNLPLSPDITNQRSPTNVLAFVN